MRIAYVVNNAAFFVSHRLPIGNGALAAGHQVMLLTGQGGSVTLESAALEVLHACKMPHRALAFGSSGVNPLRELAGLLQLTVALHRMQPDVVHCVSPKGILYGGLASRLVGVRSLVLAVSGMGYLFTGRKRGPARWMSNAYQRCVRLVYGHGNKRVIVQNHDDWRALQAAGLALPVELVLIPGSGVRLADYAAIDERARQDLVVLPARMLRDKGVYEFVDAARTVRAAGVRWRFALVGTADYLNPTAVPLEQIQRWVARGDIEWWGHREDMPAVLAQARIVCLPSYREGMPKALLEAAAAGCAVVTTDVIGCREAVVPGVTGDLVPVSDADALARCLLALINDPPRRARYALAGRQRAVERFSQDSVVAQILGIYKELNHGASD